MAGRGPAPKDPEKRIRRNAAPDVTDIPKTARARRAPKLPPKDGDETWHPATVRWYQVWRRSPQASTFTTTDWQRLHMMAPLVDEYFHEPKTALLAEIRLNEAKLGATPEDRQRLKVRIVEEEEPQVDRGPSSRERKDPRLALIAGGKKA